MNEVGYGELLPNMQQLHRERFMAGELQAVEHYFRNVVDRIVEYPNNL